ncbi:hypothetical protein [Agrobacterium deltaense]|uniref:Uncharacterized protein n=1 Tax=Agrobacterium deltaense NCPPB 1641 TaxID=1183425 RepID=A0A1S7U3R2_9HYPH|nr:hypothetical protein [Agrobacterium deltaense]CVI61300.1 exported hypothetical protein [Agrobacterium deltaense NCPPB 1641]
MIFKQEDDDEIFLLVLATAFGLSFAWSVAVAKDKPVQQPAAKSRQDEQRRQPACAKDQREKRIPDVFAAPAARPRRENPPLPMNGSRRTRVSSS